MYIFIADSIKFDWRMTIAEAICEYCLKNLLIYLLVCSSESKIGSDEFGHVGKAVTHLSISINMLRLRKHKNKRVLNLFLDVFINTHTWLKCFWITSNWFLRVVAICLSPSRYVPLCEFRSAFYFGNASNSLNKTSPKKNWGKSTQYETATVIIDGLCLPQKTLLEFWDLIFHENFLLDG